MATRTWTGDTSPSGNWSTNAAWAGGQPATDDSAVINQNPRSSYTVTLDVSTPVRGGSLAGLSVGSTKATLLLSAAGKTLSVAGPAALSNGAIKITNTATLASDAFLMSGGTFAQSNGKLIVADSDGDSLSVTAGTFSLSGAGNISVTGGATFSGGTETVSAGALNAGSVFVSGGNLSLSGGTTTVAGATTLSSGSIAINTSGPVKTGSLAVAGGRFSQSAGRLTTGGLVTVTDGAATVSGGTFSNGNLGIAGGSLLLSGGTVASSGATFLTSGSLSIENVGTLATSLLNASGGAFTQSAGKATVNFDASFSGGNNQILGGTFNAGTLDVVGDATVLNIAAGTVVSGNGGVNIHARSKIRMTDTRGVLNATKTGLVNDGTLSGMGTVSGTLTGSGTVMASDGVLALASNIISTSLAFTIDASKESALKLDGTVASGANFRFLGAAGSLIDNNAGATLSANVIGMNVGAALQPTNSISFRSSAVTIVGANMFTGTQATVHLSDGSALALSGVTGNTEGSWFVNTSSAPGATELWLSTVCFAAGTRILTAVGERAIETLREGDSVLTLRGRELLARPVKWLGRRRLDLTAHRRPETVAPIRVRRGAFATNVPHTDLLVSPDHAIFVEGRLICARQLINGTTILQEISVGTMEYFHLELDAHAILFAEGLPAESYLDTGNRGFFANADAPLVLHPDLMDDSDLPRREAASCAPFISDEASVYPVWRRLAERAAMLGQPAAMLRGTCDPALRIVTGGRPIRPTHVEGGRFIFALPTGATSVRLVSRAARPTDARPWLEDRRRLGIRVQRILLRGPRRLQDIPLDHPALSDGWWAIEHPGHVLRRWTDGDALLPLPASPGPTLLEVWVEDAGLQYPAGSDAEALAA